MLQGCQGRTKPHTARANQITSSLCLTPEPYPALPVGPWCLQAHLPPLAGKPALQGLWGGVPVEEQVEAQEGGFVSPHTRSISPGWEEI